MQRVLMFTLPMAAILYTLILTFDSIDSLPYEYGSPDYSEGSDGPEYVPEQQPQRQASKCICKSTIEYNPVCGSDNRTYFNPQTLECVNRCAKNGVVLAYMARCLDQLFAEKVIINPYNN